MIVTLLCGALVGFMLALVGGGGSILATPLLIYGVGMSQPHLAVGTGALAVTFNAFINLLSYARRGHVWWQYAIIFALFGVAGAIAGSVVGKATDGRHLLVLFGLLMLVVSVLMFRERRIVVAAVQPLDRSTIIKSGGVALCTGFASGFFGIGGGFLIVPALILVTGMPTLNAIATSLFVVGALALTTTASYAASGLVDFKISLQFIAGGIIGGAISVVLAKKLSSHGTSLGRVFSVIVAVVAVYMLWNGIMAPLSS